MVLPHFFSIRYHNGKKKIGASIHSQCQTLVVRIGNNKKHNKLQNVLRSRIPCLLGVSMITVIVVGAILFIFVVALFFIRYHECKHK
jgi:hypothetical protein